MKKLRFQFLNIFKKKNKPCLIMEGLRFRSIPANYPALITIGPNGEQVERPAMAKVWQVAVKTSEPDSYFKTHAAWMIHIQFEHADTSLRIGELEHLEALKGVKSYMNGVREFNPEPIKNR